jgi:hypothetical protein
MNNKQRGFTVIVITVILYVAFVLVVVCGWVGNLVKIARTDWDKPLTPKTIVRIVGIPIVPLGAVMGYVK